MPACPPVLLSQRGGPGGKCARAGAFPCIISARKTSLPLVPAYPSPGTVAGGGANACPGKAAEKGANASPGTLLGGGYANGIATYGFAQVKEGAAEPAATAEGDARAGAM